MVDTGKKRKAEAQVHAVSTRREQADLALSARATTGNPAEHAESRQPSKDPAQQNDDVSRFLRSWAWKREHRFVP